MKKKVAVITGGAGGIGTAICQRLAANYHTIACYFRNGHHEEVLQWQASQKAAGFDVEIMYANIAEFADCAALVNVVKEQYGRIDVLVNNAGNTSDSSFKKMTPQQWQHIIDSNLTGVFNMTRNVLPCMLENGFGRIINISSVNGRKGQIGQCNYAATKSALYGFSKSLALEVAHKGITVNTISPGYTKTPMLDTVKEEVLASIIAATL